MASAAEPPSRPTEGGAPLGEEPVSNAEETPTEDVDPALEADEAEAENASDIDERISRYTASLASSVVDYPREYGRRYHAFRHGSYFLPNDEAEMERLDMAHAMMVKAIGNRLFLAPLEKDKVRRILDVGTGTGIWAVEMGDVFESAEVKGVDLSATQTEWVPPNVKFEVDDVESPWVPGEMYDYIFCRFLAASIADWPKLIKNIYDHLNPGGWAEFHEMDPEVYSEDETYTEEHATWAWNQAFLKAMKDIGRDPSPGPKVEGWVRDTGFENIFHQRFKNPLGPWAKDPYYKDLGILNLAQMSEGLEGFTLRVFCGLLGRTREEVIVEVAKVRKEMKSDAYHGLYDIHVVYGQKPLKRSAPVEL